MRSLPALVAVILGVHCVSLTADRSAASLPFRLIGPGNIVVPVTIGGQGPFRFGLDTGASRSVVSVDLARRLRLEPVASTLVVTPVGQEAQPLARLERVSLGAMPVPTVIGLILPGDRLGRETSIDGLIGQDVLSPLVYTIDYVKRRIFWHGEVVTDPPGVRLALESNEGWFLVSVPRNRCAPARASTATSPDPCSPLQLVPDSGADGFVLFERPGRVLPPVTPLDTARLRTVSGQRVVRRVQIDDLYLGSIRLTNQAAVIVEVAEQKSILGDGLLPLHLFARVTFNGTGRYLILEGW